MKRVLASFAAGVLFAAGLALAGMTQPARIVGFLDVTGRWDPSLALVMVGAVAVYAIAWRMSLRLRAPVLASRFHRPERREIDARLFIGSSLFGVGWALAGFCPGPALASVGAAQRSALLFVAGMAAGILLSRLVAPAPRSDDA